MTDKTYTEAVAEFGERMARLEGKFDTGFAEMKGSLDTLTQAVEAGNAARVAEAAELRKDVDDHEQRLRRQEQRKTVSPLGLWTAILGGIAGAGGLMAIFDRLAQ